MLYKILPKSIKLIFRIVRFKMSNFFKKLLMFSDVWLDDERVTIGKYTYGIKLSTMPTITKNTKISVGKFCSIAPMVVFVTGHHRYQNVSTFPFKELFLKGGMPDDECLPHEYINIGHDVWIGLGAKIVSNVNIGHGAVIASGAVVIKDVPPYAIVGGVPAKVIKMRFDDNQISRLIKVAWWDWDENLIKENLELFYEDPEKFISKFS